MLNPVALDPMAQDIDPLKLSSPRIFLVRMVVFLVLCALVVVVLYKQIWTAFLANPGLNALIIGVLLIGVLLAFRQVVRLFPEVNWVNGFRLADPGLAVERPPVLLAPMATILGDRMGRMAMSSTMMRGILDSIAARLDEARDMSRYMTGLLVFLGLLGTFWGLIETVGSVGNVINTLKPGGDAGAVFEALKDGLAAPLSGMGISFSSSLFGLAGSLVLGFLDLQTSQAQNRFYTDLEDWLSTTVRDLGVSPEGAPAMPASAFASAAPSNELRLAIERLRETISEGGSNRGGDHRDGQSRGGYSGAGPPHAHRAADDPRLGRLPGRATSRDPPPARNPGARERQQVGAPYGHGPRAPRSGNELLARLRRRPVDARPRHHLPAHRVRGGAVLSDAGSHRQRHRAEPPDRADRSLTELLSLEKSGKMSLEEQLAQLRSSLTAAEGERDRFKGLYDGAGAARPTRRARSRNSAAQLDAEKQLTIRALAQVEVLNQQIAALRRQLAALEGALDVAEKKDKEAQGQIQPISASGSMSRSRSACRNCQRYRSDFFGRLRVILGNRPDVRIVGDRFVFQSEVFFDTGQAVLKPEGRVELDKLASAR